MSSVSDFDASAWKTDSPAGGGAEGSRRREIADRAQSSRVGRFPGPRRLTPHHPLAHCKAKSQRMMSRFRPVVLRQRRSFSGVVEGAASQSLAERGYVKGLRVLDDVTVARLRVRLPLLFRGEFDTGVYPDEMHWREGISRDDAPREVGRYSVWCAATSGCRHMIFTMSTHELYGSVCLGLCTHISQLKTCVLS